LPKQSQTKYEKSIYNIRHKEWEIIKSTSPSTGRLADWHCEQPKAVHEKKDANNGRKLHTTALRQKAIKIHLKPKPQNTRQL